MFLLAFLINEKIIHLTENWVFSYPNCLNKEKTALSGLALIMADSSQVKAIACFREVPCLPRPAQQMSHKFLQDEISKWTGKVHLEYLGATVLWLHLNKGLGIPMEFGWVWSSMLAVETAVEKDHLQYWFYLMVFNLYTDCVSGNEVLGSFYITQTEVHGITSLMERES